MLSDEHAMGAMLGANVRSRGAVEGLFLVRASQSVPRGGQWVGRLTGAARGISYNVMYAVKMWKVSTIYIRYKLFILQSHSTPPSASRTKCRAMVLKSQKLLLFLLPLPVWNDRR